MVSSQRTSPGCVNGGVCVQMHICVNKLLTTCAPQSLRVQPHWHCVGTPLLVLSAWVRGLLHGSSDLLPAWEPLLSDPRQDLSTLVWCGLRRKSIGTRFKGCKMTSIEILHQINSSFGIQNNKCCISVCSASYSDIAQLISQIRKGAFKLFFPIIYQGGSEGQTFV